VMGAPMELVNMYFLSTCDWVVRSRQLIDTSSAPVGMHYDHTMA